MSNFSILKERLMQETKVKISEAVGEDLMIVQAMNTIDELNKVLNSLSKRLREWHAYTLPELNHDVEDNEAYCRLISTKSYDELKDEFGKNTMGGKLSDEDIEIQIDIAKNITETFKMKDKLVLYVETLMKRIAPNISILAGSSIGARLIVNAGSIKRLAMMPASTIQMLGAEKALFRHLKTGARPPKHGFIINHPYVAAAGNSKGKVARILADKLSQCAKIDFFKGDIVADKMRKELDEKFKKE
ncbi:MAG: NOP5/NOP56 family protein [Candidatus Nanoarchaeia archaeon]|nr:NOP5/NOP56 family protein [Candidatus Nanoarchaeia archaeon]